MTSPYLRGGIVNLHATSEPRPMARWLENFADTRDVLFLQEMTPRHLSQILFRLGDDWHMIADRGERETAAVMLRKSRFPLPTAASIFTVGTGWWGHQAGRQHAPRRLPLVVSNGTLFGSVHAPPGVDFVDGETTGPEDRVRAYRRYMKDVRLAVEDMRSLHETRTTLLAGDWNEKFDSEGRRSPQWLAKKLGLGSRFHPESIDYALLGGEGGMSGARPMGRGPGADHEARAFTFVTTGS